ncbi:MAG: exodeoxyribonuclease VII small subunit [Clostridia bacterium]|nr:exodeoxyribonuclease VII small subunit [Clostridia bacterium]
MKDFEKNILELEKIVKKLEDDKITLTESIELYEKGINLSAKLQKALETAEGKLTVLENNSSKDETYEF